MAAFETLWTTPSLYSSYANQRRQPAAASMFAHPDLSSSAPPRRAMSGDRAAASGASTSSVDPLTVMTSNSGVGSAGGGVGQGATLTSASALASVGVNASQTDVLLTLPPPILRLLVVSAPFVHTLSVFARLVTWTHPNKFACLLLPFGWVVLCLGGQLIAKYGFNALLLALLGVGWVAGRGGKKYSSATARDGQQSTPNVKTLALATASQPAIQVLTPSALNTLLLEATILSKHLQVLHKSFSPLLTPFTWSDTSLSWTTLNFLLTSYPFYLILTYFVALRHLVLFVGLVALSWEAPWFALIRKSLWSSLLVRRGARIVLRLLQGDLRTAQLEARAGQADTGFLAKIRLGRSLSNLRAEKTAMVGQNGGPASETMSLQQQAATAATAVQRQDIEIQYLFTIYENQRWWIGLEWTQALLPNERPSWSDSTLAACSPPGSFNLPTSTTVSSGSTVTTYSWKWAESEWRIRGTGGVLISPGTIGANPNPPATSSPIPSLGGQSSSTSSAGKDLKDVMGSLGDWRNMLASRTQPEEQKEKERRSSIASADAPASPTSHARKSSASLFGDSLSNLIGAKDGKPVIQSNIEKVNENADKQDIKEKLRTETQEGSEHLSAPRADADIPGHPNRIAEHDTPGDRAADWVVDSQGWQYADNHWEKPTSKGGMGRYTRRRAWVRKAIVVEHTSSTATSGTDSSKKHM